MKSSLWMVLGGALSIVVATGCGSVSGHAGKSGPTEPGCDLTMPAGFPTTTAGIQMGQTGPDVKLFDLSGNAVCARGYAGKVVLLNTGAGWCPPCKAEAHGIELLYEKYKDQGFEVLMAMYQSTGGGAPNQAFMDQWAQAYGITFLLVPDRTLTFWNAYARSDDPNYPPPGYVAIPLNVLLDRDQVVRYNYIGGGASEPNTLDGIINTYVNTPASLAYPTPAP